MKYLSKKQFLVLSFLLVLGMIFSLFLLSQHFSAESSAVCNFGSSFDCGVVNKSPYANLDGISYLLTIDFGLPLPLLSFASTNMFIDLLTANAFLGFLTLSLLLGLAYYSYKKKKLPLFPQLKPLPIIWTILFFSVLYGGFLFFIQHSILRTYCIFCLGLDVVLISSFIFVWKIKATTLKEEKT